MQGFTVILCLLAMLGLSYGQITPTPMTDQFAAAAAPPHGITLDTVKGEIVNFETMMPKPICVTSDGAYVLVANEADARMVVLDADLSPVTEVPLGLGIAAIAERPGGAAVMAVDGHGPGVHAGTIELPGVGAELALLLAPAQKVGLVGLDLSEAILGLCATVC